MIKEENKDYSDDEDERLDIEEDLPRKDKLMDGKLGFLFYNFKFFFLKKIKKNFIPVIYLCWGKFSISLKLKKF